LTLHVVVIGAGIVGAVSAVELLRDGHRVTILEPGPPGGEQAASYGNGTMLSPSSVVPISMPGMWRNVPKYLSDPLGPLAIRWAYLPKVAPWLWRFLRAGSTKAKVRKTARALRDLLGDCPERHRRLAEEAGVGDLIRKPGLLTVFPDRSAFAAESFAWELRRENGIRWLELDEDALRQQEPALDRRYKFGLLIEECGQCLDPGAYVAGLIAHAEAQGAVRRQGRATGFSIAAGRLKAVKVEGGQGDIPCDRAVISAGAHSRVLAAAAGDRVSLETERGYHVMIENPGIAPRYPTMPSDGKMANVMTNNGFRLAGQVELAGLDAAPNWKRAEILRDFAQSAWPGLPRDLPMDKVKVWMGHRPSTPDGLPCIGPASGCADIVHAYGHGHVGLAGGAMTGRLVADVVSALPPTVDLAPFSPQRFSR
jgi:D-amino-acid dehydrogenase